ncbi:unnamed protein product [Paramecium octaurelia]|uniref:Cyclic nucleotide-binding domain-containing protein n=1 Tax=Paramecium octaurelia TaxID=43137 RepID=A0A8S1WPU3_PAROT|nr:unnamed protein product [Paramecium octaurelia]
MNFQLLDTLELGNKRNQARLLEQIHELTTQQKKKLLINILKCSLQERKQEILQMMRILLEKVDIFQQFQTDQNDLEAYDYCLRHIQYDTFDKNAVIYEIGEYANNVYMVISGQVSLYIYDDIFNTTKRRQQSFSVGSDNKTQQKERLKYSDHIIQSLVRLSEIKEWKIFGEQLEKKRMNIAICDIESQVGFLSKETFQTAISIMQRKQEQKRMKSFTLSPSFQGLNKRLLNLMLFSFSTQDYKFRDVVYKKGQLDSDVIYIIKQGEFVVYQQKQNVRKQLAIMTEGEFFGDYEAFEKVPRQFNVSCHSHHGSLIVIPMQILNQKLSQYNEQCYLQQLKKLCIKKNKWYKSFENNIEQTQGIYQRYLTVQDLKNEITKSSAQKIEPIQNVPEIQQQQISPIRELKNTLSYLTSIEESQVSNSNININHNTNNNNNKNTKTHNNNHHKLLTDNENNQKQKAKSKNPVYIASPDKLQPLPKIQLVSNKQQNRSELSTPDRFNKVIQNKISVLKRINNLSPEENINLNTLHQKTYYVQLPKQIKLEQHLDKEWPIKATLYLNDLDDRFRFQNNQSSQNNNSNRNCNQLPEQLSSKNENSEQNSQRNSRIDILNNILQYKTPKQQNNKKRRALTLKYREYIESQFPPRTERSLLFC